MTPLALWQVPDIPVTFIATSYWVRLVVYAICASVVTVWPWMTGLRHVDASSAHSLVYQWVHGMKRA